MQTCFKLQTKHVKCIKDLWNFLTLILTLTLWGGCAPLLSSTFMTVNSASGGQIGHGNPYVSVCSCPEVTECTNMKYATFSIITQQNVIVLQITTLILHSHIDIDMSASSSWDLIQFEFQGN